MGEAMEPCDFALHQRPLYIESWRQTDWLNAYERATVVLQLWQQYDQRKLAACAMPKQVSKDRLKEEPNALQKIRATTQIYAEQEDGTNSEASIPIFRTPVLEWYQLWLALRTDKFHNTEDYQAEPPWYQLRRRFFEHLRQFKNQLCASPAVKGEIAGQVKVKPNGKIEHFTGIARLKIDKATGQTSIAVALTGTFTPTDPSPNCNQDRAATRDAPNWLVKGNISGAIVKSERRLPNQRSPWIFKGRLIAIGSCQPHGEIEGEIVAPQYANLIGHYEELHRQRSLVAKAEAQVELDRRWQRTMPPLEYEHEQLQTARKLYEQWNQVDADFRTLGQLQYLPELSNKGNQKVTPEIYADGLMTFAGRWALDIYQEWTLLTCRSLAQAGAYELLYVAGSTAQAICDAWMHKWRGLYANQGEAKRIKPHETFSPYILC